MYIPPWKIIDYIVSFLALYIVVLVILIYLLNRERMVRKPEKTNYAPVISVVIPAYNEENNIGKCIESLLNLDYPRDKVDIIVVDDGSTDNTYQIALKYKEKGVRVFKKKNEGTSAASKNYGIRRARGELIATLDADSYVAKDIVKKMLPFFSEKDIVAVTSAVKVAKPKGFLKKLQEIEYIVTIFSRRVLSFVDAVFVTPGPFSLFRSSLFRKIGLFDEKSILEDQEIALRIQKHNLKIRSSLDAEVFTDVPGNFFSLIRQRIRWHRGGLVNSLKYFHLINPKYGDFGVIILPLGLLAIFCIFLVIANMGYNVMFKYDVSEVRFIDNIPLIFQPVHFVGIIILVLTIGFTVYQMSFFKRENLNPLWAIVFIVCYAYLITLYWLLAVGKQIIGEELSW